MQHSIFSALGLRSHLSAVICYLSAPSEFAIRLRTEYFYATHKMYGQRAQFTMILTYRLNKLIILSCECGICYRSNCVRRMLRRTALIFSVPNEVLTSAAIRCRVI